MNAAPSIPWPQRDANSEHALLFGNAPVGMARCSEQGSITAVNPALGKVLAGEFPVDDPSTPLELFDLIQSEDRAEVGRRLRQVFAGERESFQIESRIPANDGCSTSLGRRSLRWTIWGVRDGSAKNALEGSPDYAFLLAEDVSEQWIAEQRHREAAKLEAVGRLAGGVAHDFNNLLTGITLYCDLMLAALEPDSRMRQHAEEVRAAGMQGAALVRQLLSVARPAQADPRPLSLNPIAEGMRDLLARLIGENIELVLVLDQNLGSVHMDAAQAQQMLLNLVLNARDAMPAGGRITVETRNCSIQILPGSAEVERLALLPCVLLAVSDTGSGMDEHTREHLFEAFFTTKTDGRGTGLGLATVHDIVTSSGGLIRADSKLGCGTRFIVLLPLVSKAEPQSSSGIGFSPEGNEGDLPFLIENEKEKEITP